MKNFYIGRNEKLRCIACVKNHIGSVAIDSNSSTENFNKKKKYASGLDYEFFPNPFSNETYRFSKRKMIFK